MSARTERSIRIGSDTMVLDEDTKKQLVFDYLNTYVPFGTICKEYGLSRQYGYKILQDNGIETGKYRGKRTKTIRKSEESKFPPNERFINRIESIERKLDRILELLESN